MQEMLDDEVVVYTLLEPHEFGNDIILPTGHMMIIVPSPRWEGTLHELVEKDVLVQHGVQCPWAIVKRSELPEDYAFRDAWRWDGKRITIDMEVAREVTRKMVKNLVSEKFNEIGIPENINHAMVVLLPDEVRGTIEQLRELPVSLDLSGAKTPEGLRDLIPAMLKETGHDTNHQSDRRPEK